MENLEETIKDLLLEKFPAYKGKAIVLADLTKRISALPDKYQTPLLDWLRGGDIPEFEHSGYSVSGLIEKNFTVPSAVLALAWLEYDSETAKKALESAGVIPVE